MARKVFCDGCDTQLPNSTKGTDNQHGATIRIETANGSSLLTVNDLDLCETCLRQLVEQSDPRNWIRCVSERSATSMGY